MSTSGTYSFNLNMSQCITLAFQEINVQEVNVAVNADDYAFASNKLNLMLKYWEVLGVKLWKRRIGYLFTALNRHDYELGSVTGSDNCTNTYVSTTLTSLSGSNLTVASITGF